MVDFYECDWQVATAAQLADAEASLAGDAMRVGAVRSQTTGVSDNLGRLNGLARRYLGVLNEARDAGNCLGRRWADIEVVLSRRRLQAMPTFAALKTLDVASGPIRVRSRGDVELALNAETPANPQAALAAVEVCAPITLSFFGTELQGDLIVSVGMVCRRDGVWPALWRRPRLRGLAPDLPTKTRAALERRCWALLEDHLAGAPVISAAELQRGLPLPNTTLTPAHLRSISNDYVSLVMTTHGPTRSQQARVPLAVSVGQPTADEIVRMRTDLVFDLIVAKAKKEAADHHATLEETGRVVVPYQGVDQPAVGVHRGDGILYLGVKVTASGPPQPLLIISFITDKDPSHPGNRQVLLVASPLVILPPRPPASTVVLKTLTPAQQATWSVDASVIELRVRDP
jgi:hypothetical protein